MALKQGARALILGAPKEYLHCAKLFYGSATTTAGVHTDVDTEFSQDIGSIYVNNTAGIFFIKTAKSTPTVAADWTVTVVSSPVNLANNVTGILPVANGGSGLAAITAHKVPVGNGTSAETLLAIGATGTVLRGQTGADPVFGAVVLTTDVTGVLPIANGGSNGQIVAGAAVTRAAVLAAFPTVPIGSIYMSTGGKVYIKVANAGAATDWQLVTATAAD
jgi:hypothetical protein